MKGMTNVLFLTMWSLLIVIISVNAPATFKEINSTLARNVVLMNGENEETAHRLTDYMKDGNPWRERAVPYYRSALTVRDSTRAYLQYLEGWKQQLSGKNDAEVRRLLFRENGATEIFQWRNRLLAFYLGHIDHRRGRRELAKEWNLHIPVNTDSVAKDLQLVANTFQVVTAASAISVLLVLENDILRSEKMVLNALAHYGERPGSCAFSAAIAYPGRNFFFQGEQETGKIMYAQYLTNRTLRFFDESNGRVVSERGYGTWTGKAIGTGRRHVTGKVSVWADTGMVIRQWSLDYFVSTPHAFICWKNYAILRGVVNPVTLMAAASYNKSVLDLIIPGATVLKVAAGSYEVIPDKNAPAVLKAYIVHLNKNKQKDTIAVELLTVKNLPLPQVQVSGSQDAVIPVDVFKEVSVLSAMSPDSDFMVSYIVEGFDIELQSIKKDETTGPFHVDGAHYNRNPQTKELLRQAASGDYITFSKIIVTDPNGTKLHLPAYTIRLK